MMADLVVPTGRNTLRNLKTGEQYPYRIVEEAHPPKVEYLDVELPNGVIVRAMCISIEEGYGVYFQGLNH